MPLDKAKLTEIARQIRGRMDHLDITEMDATLTRLVYDLWAMLTYPEPEASPEAAPVNCPVPPDLDISFQFDEIWKRLRLLEKYSESSAKYIEELFVFMSSVKPTTDMINSAITSMRSACDIIDHLIDARSAEENKDAKIQP